MQIFDVGKVIKAVTTLRALEQAISDLEESEKHKKSDPVERNVGKLIIESLDEINEAIVGLGAKTAALSISELRAELTAHKIKITYRNLPDAIAIVAVTLRRELSLQKTFCLDSTRQQFFESDFSAFGSDFETRFPSAVYEIDEAGKCYAFGRSTASVFHLMRAMEIAVNAIAASLGIRDLVQGNPNWGQILAKIKSEMDRKTTARQWTNSDKDFFASAFTSLDTVRVAWRNTTMHVENKYTEDEAEHIFISVRGFLKKLSSRMDEAGQPLA